MLVTSSMVGEKRELFIIGKRKKPRYLKNFKTLPVDYEANKKNLDNVEDFRITFT